MANNSIRIAYYAINRNIVYAIDIKYTQISLTLRS